MKLLVVAATELEIAPFIKMNADTEVLITGIGIPTTVYHLTKKLLQNKYDLVIQAGIAGSFSKKVMMGEVVVIEKDTFADVGIEENKKFKTIFDLGLDDENKYPYTKGWLHNPSQIFTLPELKKVRGVTINKLTGRKRQTNQLRELFNADIESMEGAAFHFVCLQQNIPFVQLRSISNKVGERDKKKWKIKEAVKNLNIELQKLVDIINKQ